jgi:hypothetical protein
VEQSWSMADKRQREWERVSLVNGLFLPLWFLEGSSPLNRLSTSRAGLPSSVALPHINHLWKCPNRGHALLI